MSERGTMYAYLIEDLKAHGLVVDEVYNIAPRHRVILEDGFEAAAWCHGSLVQIQYDDGEDQPSAQCLHCFMRWY